LVISEMLNWLSVGLAGVTAWFWIKAATGNVAKTGGEYDKPPEHAGTLVVDGGNFADPPSGGVFLATRSGWVNLPETMKIQASWNAWAAWASAATAGVQALAMLATRFKM
jgi:hypothetical protein